MSMDHGAVVSRIVEEIKNDGGGAFDLDDPFDDPSLVTTAFLDIQWQDEHGNSALMLAAAENRVLHVKGILTMAINSGKLWQILDMKNKDGLNCIQMAVQSGSETCAMLITRVAREYAKFKPKPKDGEENGANEQDITFDMDENTTRPRFRRRSVLEDDDPKPEPTIARIPPKHQLTRRLTREKITKSLKNSQQGHDYLQMMKRSRSAHSRLMAQRTLSIESEASVGASHPPHEHGVLSSMGERIRNIFSGKKPPAHSSSMTHIQTDRLPVAARSYSSSDKSAPYHDYQKRNEEEMIRLPQQSSDDDSHMFRNSPWAHSKSQSSQGNVINNNNYTNSSNHNMSNPSPMAQNVHKTCGGPAGSNLITSSNGVRLPPLSLRRRASSDPRNREFHSIIPDH